MKALYLIPALLLVAATSSAADLSPNPIGVTVPRPGYTFPGVALPVVIQTRTGHYPPYRLGDTRVVGREVEIEVILPESTTVVEPYDAVLMTRFVPTEAGNWQVKVFARKGLERQLEASSTVNVFSPGIQLTYRGPQPPSENDEIVVELDHRPPQTPQIRTADNGQIRLVSAHSSFWQPAPEGYRFSLGRLPAGNYQVELYTYSEGIQDQLQIAVEPTPAEPGPIVLAGDFEVVATWENAAGATGEAQLVQPPSRDSALLYFFSPANWELMVKVLDGCAINGHYWVFGAASTDVGYTLEITRRSTGETFRSQNRIGVAAPAITNISAFPCS